MMLKLLFGMFAIYWLKEELNLIDPFREIYENFRQYTWRKRNPIKQARLDFFLISEAIMPSVKDISIISSYRSDHSSVVLSLEINEFKHGKDFGNLILVY